MRDALKNTEPNEQREVATAELLPLLEELMRLALGNGLNVPQFVRLAEYAAVSAVQRDFAKAGLPDSNARISLRTGLHRKKVGELRQSHEGYRSSFPNDLGANTVENVLSAWHHDKEFCLRDGSPMPLKKSGGRISFADLVAKYTPDHSPQAVLSELMQGGAVEERRGHLVPVHRAIVPKPASPQQVRIGILNIRELMGTVVYNTQEARASGIKLFQRSAFEEIPISKTPEFYRKTQPLMAEYLTRLEDIMLNLRDDRVQGEALRRVGVAMYQFLDK